MGYYNNPKKPYRAYHPKGEPPRNSGNNYSGRPHKDHQTPFQKFFRALISIFTSIGFCLFWYGLATGIDDNILFFALGIVLMTIGVIHIFIGMKKDADHREFRLWNLNVRKICYRKMLIK